MTQERRHQRSQSNQMRGRMLTIHYKTVFSSVLSQPALQEGGRHIDITQGGKSDRWRLASHLRIVDLNFKLYYIYTGLK